MIEPATLSTTKITRPIRDRFRIRFAKFDLLRWIGHHDLQRLWERMLRRNQLQLLISDGFHPRPRISFPSALALGVEGLDEVVEIELAQTITAEELRLLLVRDGQPGLTIGEVTLMATKGGNGDGTGISPGLNKAKHHSSDYEIEIPDGYDLTRVDRAIEINQTLEVITVQRKEKTICVWANKVFPVVTRRDRFICVTQIEIDGPSVRITDLLDTIQLTDLLPLGGIIRRTQLYLTDQLT